MMTHTQNEMFPLPHVERWEGSNGARTLMFGYSIFLSFCSENHQQQTVGYGNNPFIPATYFGWTVIEDNM